VAFGDTSGLVIVEGTCGTGKTTLLRAAGSTCCEREVRLLTQRATYAPLVSREDDRTLDDPGTHRFLREVVGEIRRELAGANRLVLVDTLHATHFVRVGALTVASFVDIDRELSDLHALVIVLRLGERSIRARTIVGRRGTGFSEYARKFGANEDERTTYFVREQDRLVELLHTHSCLRHVVLDADQSPETLQEEFRGVVQEHLAAQS